MSVKRVARKAAGVVLIVGPTFAAVVAAFGWSGVGLFVAMLVGVTVILVLAMLGAKLLEDQ